jgi:PRD1 phage membrane DNA delivery
MGDQVISSVVTVATAIVGVAILAVLVSKQANTAQVLQAATGGFAQDLSAAVSPITGGGGLGSGFTGGGANFITNY